MHFLIPDILRFIDIASLIFLKKSWHKAEITKV